MTETNGYAGINNAWGCDPHTLRKPSGKEALKACRLLLAEGFRAYGTPAQARRKRRFKLVSGRNKTWPHNSVMVKGERVQLWNVNPDECGLGFAEIIHSVSHWVHNAVNPGLSRRRGGGHEGHAHIEQYLVDWVIKRRWVEDGLSVRPDKAPPDKSALRAKKLATLEGQLKAWTTKQRRATTAIKKLNTRIKRLTKKES